MFRCSTGTGASPAIQGVDRWPQKVESHHQCCHRRKASVNPYFDVISANVSEPNMAASPSNPHIRAQTAPRFPSTGKPVPHATLGPLLSGRCL